MSGEKESKKQTIDERHEKIEHLLKQYPEEMGLSMIAPSAVTTYINCTPAETRRLTAEECGEASIVLSQMSVYVQLEINRMQADMNWCDSCIDFMVANIIHSTGNKYTPFQYKRIIAIKNNDVAMKLQAIIARIKLYVDDLQYLPSHLKALGSSYSDLQQTKRGQKI